MEIFHYIFGSYMALFMALGAMVGIAIPAYIFVKSTEKKETK